MEHRRHLRENLRLIWAIAAKDMSDAIKNKTTISIVIGVAFIMLSGQAMPWLLKLRAVPRAYYYDTGESILIPDLAKNDDDFDQRVDAGDSIRLEGMAVHWVKDEDVEETVSFFEQRLGDLTSASLGIQSIPVLTPMGSPSWLPCLSWWRRSRSARFWCRS